MVPLLLSSPTIVDNNYSINKDKNYHHQNHIPSSYYDNAAKGEINLNYNICIYNTDNNSSTTTTGVGEYVECENIQGNDESFNTTIDSSIVNE